MPKYKVGDHVLVRLSGGRIVEATIKAIVDMTDGTRLQVSFGGETALIYLWQVGKSVLGTRTLTATYAGDANFSGSSGTKNQQVIFKFAGFYSPLSAAGDSSYSGSYNIGKSVTAKWNLQDHSGTYLGYLNANSVLAVGPVPSVNGVCPVPSQVPKVLNSTQYPYPVATLYSPTIAAKGNTTFRIASSNNQFILNWDTTPFTAGCYVLEVDLDSGQAERTALKLQ
jgi:hypothetical protein